MIGSRVDGELSVGKLFRTGATGNRYPGEGRDPNQVSVWEGMIRIGLKKALGEAFLRPAPCTGAKACLDQAGFSAASP